MCGVEFELKSVQGRFYKPPNNCGQDGGHPPPTLPPPSAPRCQGLKHWSVRQGRRCHQRRMGKMLEWMPCSASSRAGWSLCPCWCLQPAETSCADLPAISDVSCSFSSTRPWPSLPGGQRKPVSSARCSPTKPRVPTAVDVSQGAPHGSATPYPPYTRGRPLRSGRRPSRSCEPPFTAPPCPLAIASSHWYVYSGCSVAVAGHFSSPRLCCDISASRCTLPAAATTIRVLASNPPPVRGTDTWTLTT